MHLQELRAISTLVHMSKWLIFNGILSFKVISVHGDLVENIKTTFGRETSILSLRWIKMFISNFLECLDKPDVDGKSLKLIFQPNILANSEILSRKLTEEFTHFLNMKFDIECRNKVGTLALFETFRLPEF